MCVKASSTWICSYICHNILPHIPSCISISIFNIILLIDNYSLVFPLRCAMIYSIIEQKYNLFISRAYRLLCHCGTMYSINSLPYNPSLTLYKCLLKSASITNGYHKIGHFIQCMGIIRLIRKWLALCDVVRWKLELSIIQSSACLILEE